MGLLHFDFAFHVNLVEAIKEIKEQVFFKEKKSRKMDFQNKYLLRGFFLGDVEFKIWSMRNRLFFLVIWCCYDEQHNVPCNFHDIGLF